VNDARIDVIDVTFKYGRHMILNKINFGFEQSTKVGLHAPNGAGKSTLIALLTHMMLPTQGHISVTEGDKTLSKPEFYKRLGFALSHPYFIFDFSLKENFETLQTLYLKNNQDSKVGDRLIHLLDRFELSHQWETPFKHLSQGQQKKATLIRALFHDPHFLCLDEPTLGLDKRAKHTLSSILENHPALTIIASHDQAFLDQSTHQRITIDEQRLNIC